MFLVSLLVFLCVNQVFSFTDNFPSLLSTNATIAIVLDKDYLGTNYDLIRSEIEKYFIYAKREILKHGGINVHYYSWTQINVRRDFTAVINIAPCDDMWKLFRAALEENIMFMAITDADCPRLPTSVSISIPLVMAGEELPQVLVDLRSARAYDWKTAIILYDETLERDMITRVITSITGHTSLSDVTTAGMAVTFMTIKKQETNEEQRKTIRNILVNLPLKQLGYNFLVVVSVDYVPIIMEVSKELDLVDPGSQWLYAISDTDSGDEEIIKEFAQMIDEGDNIAFVYNYTSNSGVSCSKGILCHTEELLESFCTALDGAIQEETALSSQVSEEEWEAVRPTKTERRDFLIRDINNHLTQFGACNNCSRWRFSSGDTWGRSYSHNYVPELLQVGHWRPTDGPTFLDELFPHIAHGFRGRNLPLVTYHNPPWQILTTNSSGSVVHYRGLVFDIIDQLSRSLNFTFTLHMTPGNRRGGDDNTVEVTSFVPQEIIEIMRAKKAIIGACGFTVNANTSFVNFTVPISVQSHSFLVARPKELSRALLFIYPFTNITWLCLALAVIGMGPILYLVNWYSPVYEFKGKVITGLTSVQNCMWYVYGALLQQGGMYLPEADSSRLIVGTWWLMVLIVVTTYCGNLVAFLTFPKIDIPIKTLGDLIIHKETMSWSAIKGTLLEDYLKNAQEPKLRELYRHMIVYDQITPDIIQLIRESKHVFIGWKSKIGFIMKKQYMETGACDFAFGSDDFLDEQIAMIVGEDSPYLNMINEEISRLHQVGLIEKWLKEYLPKRDRCWKIGQLTEVSNHTVNLNDMQGCFFVLFLGFSVAITWIIIEKLYSKYKLKQEKKLIKPFIS